MLNPYKVIPAVQMQISEFRDARRSTVSDDSVLSDLWTSHNQHGIAITDISARLLPPLLGCIEQLQGSVNKLTSVVDTLALAAVAPAPSAKRTRGENRDPATVALPTTFVYTLGFSPIAVSVHPVATTTPLPVTTAPPAAHPTPPIPPSALAQAPPATPNAPPRISAPDPLAPPAAPAAPPRAHAIPQRQAALLVDPALQVVFGPIIWNRDSQNRINVRQDIVNLLAIVLPAAAQLKISSTRRYKKLSAYTAIAFASPEIANWVINSWDHAARYQ
ncbi:hypothetical protein B0H13DRAFT_1876408 [Mycena leptocephala]|nr:hypothetical protein B0H13DRAFT_1876408 [Mycena leptocephala]